MPSIKSNRDSSIPLFAQLRDKLREQILSGVLVPGSKLPSESELEQRHGVSLVTVRKALSDLSAVGLINKINGKGSFVRQPEAPAGLGPITGFYESMRRRGHTAFGKVTAVKKINADATVAAGLKIIVGSPVAAITVTRLVDGMTYGCHTAYGSSKLMERIAQEDLEMTDFITIVQERLGFRMGHSDMEFSAANADARIAKSLGTKVGEPILRLRISTVDTKGIPLIFSEFLGHGHRFHYQLSVNH